MTRVRDREIFALLDGSLRERRREILEKHLSECRECSSRLERFRRLREAALESAPVGDPDWSRIDPVVLAAAAESARPSPAHFAAPFALAGAAAAVVAVAVAFSLLDVEPEPPKDEVRPPAARIPDAVATAEHMEATLADVTAAGLRPGGSIGPGAHLETGTNGAARLAIGSGIEVEIGPGASLELASLGVATSAISLERGSLALFVPVGSLEREMEILASGSSLYLLDGTVEIVASEEHLTVRVLEGALVAEDRPENAVLSLGEWRCATGADAIDDGWEPVEATPPDDRAPATSQREARPPAGEREAQAGALPEGVVQERIRRVRPLMRSCYEDALHEHPSLEISLTIRLDVGAGGEIAGIDIAGAESLPRLEGCLSSALAATRFPPPQGGPVELIVPLRFSPKR